MAFTYDITTDRGKVRLEIGDVTSSGSVFADDEIDYFLTEETAVRLAAARAMETLAMKIARNPVSFAQGGLNITMNASECREAARELRRTASGGAATIAMTRKDGYSHDIVAGS